MPTKKQKKPKHSEQQDMLDSIHAAAAGLHRAGVIDVKTMRHFDQECLTPVRPFSGAEIRALRKREQVSQAMFASYLNVTKGLISQWERDERSPAGPSLKLLALAAKNGLSAIA